MAPNSQLKFVLEMVLCKERSYMEVVDEYNSVLYGIKNNCEVLSKQ
jgi:hypothetical protein